jgi:hypothetical protein
VGGVSRVPSQAIEQLWFAARPRWLGAGQMVVVRRGGGLRRGARPGRWLVRSSVAGAQAAGRRSASCLARHVIVPSASGVFGPCDRQVMGFVVERVEETIDQEKKVKHSKLSGARPGRSMTVSARAAAATWSGAMWGRGVR